MSKDTPDLGDALSVADFDTLVDEHIYNGEYKTAQFWAEKRLALFANRSFTQRLPEIAKYLNVSLFQSIPILINNPGSHNCRQLANDFVLLQSSRIVFETHCLYVFLRKCHVQCWKLLWTRNSSDSYFCKLFFEDFSINFLTSRLITKVCQMWLMIRWKATV